MEAHGIESATAPSDGEESQEFPFFFGLVERDLLCLAGPINVSVDF